nr:2-dehydropantoate 2-reductase [uncultured Anaerostipes sp.]
MREIKTAALIGLGAIGGYVAPKLHTTLEPGDFTVIAGGERKQRLEQEGCCINDKVWKFHIGAPEEAGKPADLVIFAVKYHGLRQAVRDAAGYIGKDTILMSLLNGVESEEILREFYPNHHILYSVIRIPSVHENGRITYPDEWGEISFGDARNDTLSEDVQAVRDLFEKSGIGYQIPVDMKKNMWHKFMTNVSENQISAVLRMPYGIFQVSDEINMFREQTAREVIAIAQAKGIDLTEDDLEAQKTKVEAYPFWGKTSTTQDIESGRKTETEMFAGAVIRMGKELGIPTPCNEMLYHCIHALEAWNDTVKQDEKSGEVHQ